MKPATWTLPPGTRAVLLCRVSDKKQAAQDRTSLEDQERACRALATQLGKDQHFTAKQIVVRRDPGVSGLKEDRLQAIVAACERAPCNGSGAGFVVVYDRSRFSRLDSEAVSYFTYRLRLAGWQLRSVTEPTTGDVGTDNSMNAVRSEGHAALSRMLKLKIPKGLRAHAARGEYVGSRPPFGLRRGHRGHLSFGADRDVATVRRVFRRYVAGATLQQIVAELDRDRVPPPPAVSRKRAHIRWCPGTVRVILGNAAYRGTLVYQPRDVRDEQDRVIAGPFKRGHVPKAHWIVVEGAHAPIIDKATFDAAHRRLHDEHRPWRSERKLNPYWLSGLMTCAVCEGPVVGGGGARRNKKDGRFYRCRNGNGHAPTCAKPLLSVDKKRVEITVAQVVTQHVARLLKDGSLAKALDRVLGDLKDEVQDRRRLEREQGKLETERNEIVRRIGRKVLSDEDAASALAEIKGRLAAVQRELAEAALQPDRDERAEQRQAALAAAKELPRLLAQAPVPVARELIQSWVSAIVLDKRTHRGMIELRPLPVALTATGSSALRSAYRSARWCGARRAGRRR
jgi:DNA invertase Pin-like site-specific DNA recombinase